MFLIPYVGKMTSFGLSDCLVTEVSEELWFGFKIEPPFENDVFRIIDLFLCSLQELDGESEGSKETNEEDESYSETY